MNLANYRKTDANDLTRFGCVEDAMRRFSMGRYTLMEQAKQAGAVVRIGRKVLINYHLLDEFLDSISGD